MTKEVCAMQPAKKLLNGIIHLYTGAKKDAI